MHDRDSVTSWCNVWDVELGLTMAGLSYSRSSHDLNNLKTENDKFCKKHEKLAANEPM